MNVPHRAGGPEVRDYGKRPRRNRASAKAAGTRFERAVADYLAAHVDERIDRRVKTGSNDKGDIAGLRHMGGRVVVECKDVARTDLSGWVNEADIERGNDDAIAGFVVHKRRGTARPGDQYVTGTLRDLVALLTGERPADTYRCTSCGDLVPVLVADAEICVRCDGRLG